MKPKMRLAVGLAITILLAGCDRSETQPVKFINPEKVMQDSGLAEQLKTRLQAVDKKLRQGLEMAQENGASLPEEKRRSALLADRQLLDLEWQHEQSARKKTREITLTLGVFFDGTGNNAVNTDNMLKACLTGSFNYTDSDAALLLAQCGKEKMGVEGIGATSYTGDYTNVHWLSTLYRTSFSPDSEWFQRSLYVEGVGTEAGKPDSTLGMGLGISDTGVIAKTHTAVARLAEAVQQAIVIAKNELSGYAITVKAVQFDIFGFSRGAAAARHFANRIQGEDRAVIEAIRQGMGDTGYKGAPAGKTRFTGLFDTVAAIGTPVNGLNPHSADTGEVNLLLRPGVAEKVFQITTQNECRFNFALNSVRPAWPELALPGAHSDIGGGYLPQVRENLYLTRPRPETVPHSLPDQETQGYRQAVAELSALDRAPAILPILRTSEIEAETWHDARMPQDRYGNLQKRSYAALTLRNRTVKNSWSKVALRVMMDAAMEAGVIFDAIDPANPGTKIPPELISLTQKAITMGKAARSGRAVEDFTTDETDIIARDYMHCSAHWNAIITDVEGILRGGASPSAIIGFTNRPDEGWRRTIYNMDGKKV